MATDVLENQTVVDQEFSFNSETLMTVDGGQVQTEEDSSEKLEQEQDEITVNPISDSISFEKQNDHDREEKDVDSEQVNSDEAANKAEENSKRPMTFTEQEAMLNAYLEEQEKKKREAENPKPKRKSIAEMLKNLPGNVLNRKPMIRPSTKAVIDLDEDVRSEDEKRKKGIEELMSRFAIHTNVKKPPKEEHYKLHITTREEDSQGILHLKTDEAEYVKHVEEESDEDDKSVHIVPGQKRQMLMERLKKQIQAERHRAMEEKIKAHAMYSEEKEVEEKDGKEEEEEEILEDEEMSESEAEEEDDKDGGEDEADDEGNGDDDDGNFAEDEDVEALLDGTAPEEKKKKRRRLVYLEDEASESGEENSGDENEDSVKVTAADLDFIDDRPVSDEEGTDDEEPPTDPKNTSLGFEADNQASQKQVRDDGMSQDLFSQSQPLFGKGSLQESQRTSPSLFGKESQQNSEPLFEKASLQDSQQASQSSPIPSLLDPSRTPKLSAAILNHRATPLTPWNNSRHESSSLLHPGSNISPLIPRLNSSSALEAFCEENEDKTPTLPPAVAKLIGNNQPVTPSRMDEDELEGLCSARFPSQQPKTPQESQEFDYFGFDEDDSLDATPAGNEKEAAAPTTANATKILTETPKTGDKVARTMRLNFQDTPSEIGMPEEAKVDEKIIDSDDEDDNGSVIGVKFQRKRKRKLEFSDDEESENEGEKGDNNEDGSAHESEAEEEEVIDEEDEESEKEYDENEEEIPKGLIGKGGKLRKEFVESEAELSGSEEGSADEDEQGQDEYEVEAGDEEEIDEEKLRQQVGKAHLKQVLDDDQREINFLQEVFFEDGDLHSEGKGRERKFRWKNMDDQAFGTILMDDDADGDIPEDELEIRRRKEKLEKLKFLQQHNISVDENTEFEETSQKLLESSQFLKLGKKTLRKIEKSTSLVETTRVTTTVNNQLDQSPQPTFVRKGSFLQRENTLTRLAEIAKINDSMSKLGTGKGFVFTMVTPPNDPQKNKGASKRPAAKAQQPKKMLKTDPAVETSSNQSNSIFKWM